MNAQPATLEQITESLIRLRDYGRWMFWSEAGVKGFENKMITVYDRTFSLSVPQTDKVVMTLKDNGAKVIYDVMVVTCPRDGIPLNHLDFRVQILNRDDLIAEDLAFADKAGIFVMSYFQRLIAFTFFARMADETIEWIAVDLVKAT